MPTSLRRRCAALFSAVPLLLGISTAAPDRAHAAPVASVLQPPAAASSIQPAESTPAPAQQQEPAAASHHFWSPGMQGLSLLVALTLAVAGYLSFRRKRTQRDKETT